jgi:orotate phosphoribosyltransferase
VRVEDRPWALPLRDELRGHVLRGEFTLAAGGTSDWYLDGRLASFGSPRVVGAAVAGELRARNIARPGDPLVAVGGPELGAVPVAVAAAFEGRWRSFAVRKRPKQGHGREGRRVEGPLRDGDRVVLVEDVVTSGGSLFRAWEDLEAHCREEGVEVRVAAFLCLLNRSDAEDDAAERFRSATGVEFVSLLRVADLGL